MATLTTKEIAKQLRALAAAQGLIAGINVREAKAHTSFVIHLTPQAKNEQRMWRDTEEYEGACKLFWSTIHTIDAEMWVPIKNLEKRVPPNFKQVLGPLDVTDIQFGVSTLRVVK